MVQDQPTLKGKTIAVTRPCGQADEEAQIIRRKGGKPYFIPTIEIKGLTDLAPINKFIDDLARKEADYVVFMSVNGVKHLYSAAETLKKSTELSKELEKTTIIAVGPRTAEELKAHKIHVDLVPTKYTSEGIAESMQKFNVSGKKVFIPRTTAANPTLKEKLEESGALVQEIHVYDSGLPKNEELKKEFLQNLTKRKINAVVFGSGLCAKNLFEMLSIAVPAEKLAILLNSNVDVVAIGPVTAKALADAGVKVDVMPEKHTFEEALTALAQFWQTQLKMP